ncbi:hypothetical protein [Pseudomonas mediterranea]|uniref:Uncharacterized protein n=1 Tax=Pseudomonas mediterranea TaxID=183795 RepID=A0AAX2DEX6_9PSED|nr:hypothetical protein [Pseudomonas mediterranea]KGU87234.1 hypothetical protein N005_01385 [Pseudomonas mediterranea CFBP 5447]SDU61962.1 hypothetical protein SAMN05216476_3698 [Pseudomonas mediterranea]
MNAALNICQTMHDAKLPPPVSETREEVARAEWLYNAAEDLLRGVDVEFQRRMRQPQGVTVAELALAVDEHVNARLADGEVHSPALGWLMLSLGRPDKNAIAELLGPSDHPLGKLGEIAEGLLWPLVEHALIAQAEDDEQ